MRLSICIHASNQKVAQSVAQVLSGDRYTLNILHSGQEFVDFVEDRSEDIDCLILLDDPSEKLLLNQLYQKGKILPVIIIEGDGSSGDPLGESEVDEKETPTIYYYHSGDVRMQLRQLQELGSFIDRAITQFLHLAPSCALSEQPPQIVQPSTTEKIETFLMLQQRRLAEKLKERLGYLGVYYKRNPQVFYRNLSAENKKELLSELSLEYRQIVLNYFAKDDGLNQSIDRLVNRAFFADLSVSQILEIHMELMDEFAKHLKLEGRSEEILLDYRLTLIDIIAHLCEMYRRSIPRENIPLDL